MSKGSTSKRRRRPGAWEKQSLLRLVVPLPGSNECARYDFEIGMREYAALGLANVHWAFFEEVLYQSTAKLARRAGRRIPEEAKQLDFSRRLGALRQLAVRMRDPMGLKRDRLLKLIPKIANANGTRQKLVHGIWDFDPGKPHRIFSRPRKGLPSKARLPAEGYDFMKMIKFALSVGELSWALEGATSPLKIPDDEPRSYMSRSFLLALAGKDPEDLGFHWPKPLATPHRRISYPARDKEKK
jgi:hypothetical protein